ncbi:MAG TPA: alpha/beta fold hydrolase [Ramlibacter sp.]|nr:alpha/beta fold hydrolase [Ramlibacter sp.]
MHLPPDAQPRHWPPPSYLTLTRGARMAFRDLGPRDGECWLVLHGGPGGAAHAGLADPLDQARMRVLLPDQRGAGASRPRRGLRGNHLEQLVSDLERLCAELGIAQWNVLAGSWGTVLALCYAQRHPQRAGRVVLRGAFRASRREVVDLLQLDPRHDGALRGRGNWPAVDRRSLPVAMAGLARVFQAGTPGVAARRALRTWDALEQRSARRGLWRSLLHACATPAASPADVARLRAAWAALQRARRRLPAVLAAARRTRADRRLLAKFRIQVHYLRHACFLRPGALDAAVRSLAHNGIPSDWVHGRFDAVCPEANSRRWVEAIDAMRPGLARLHRPASGHLAGEPRMAEALRRVVRLGKPV